jgi:hypothetical protein
MESENSCLNSGIWGFNGICGICRRVTTEATGRGEGADEEEMGGCVRNGGPNSDFEFMIRGVSRRSE